MRLTFFAISIIIKVVLFCILLVSDIVINLILLAKFSGRNVPATKRVGFSDNLKRELYKEQHGKCLYCGVQKNIKKYEIDHKDPVVRGGSNDKFNLQLLCRPCNRRKGMQTDIEYRERYKAVMQTKGTFKPPKKVISQQDFIRITKKTELGKSVKKFKASKYVSAREKLIPGTGIVAGVCGLLWAWKIPEVIPAPLMSYDIGSIGALVVGVVVWVGLLARSKYTGAFDQ